MTAVFPYLLPLLPIAAMMRSDIRTRRIDVRWLAAFAVGTMTIGMAKYGFREAAIYSAANICIFGAMLLMLGIFYGFRCLFRYGFGAGDALFFVAVAPTCDMRPYVIYLIATFACGAVWGLVSHRRSVPLVGVAGFTFVIHIALMLWMR